MTDTHEKERSFNEKFRETFPDFTGVVIQVSEESEDAMTTAVHAYKLSKRDRLNLHFVFAEYVSKTFVDSTEVHREVRNG